MSDSQRRAAARYQDGRAAYAAGRYKDAIDCFREADSLQECVPKENASATCMAGKCGSQCLAGTTTCTGACVDTRSDVANCGARGKVCPVPKTGSAACVAGTCSVSCPLGASLCQQQCVEVLSDPNNCGSCKTKCKPAQNCVLGLCL